MGMSTHAVAVAASGVFLAALPAVATASQTPILYPNRPGAVRNLTVKVLNDRCFRIRWEAPDGSRGYQYQIKVGGANTRPNQAFRSQTFRTKLKVCGLPENAYTAFVRELGGLWTYESFTLGNPF